MTSLVRQLQQAALDEKSSVSSLLRKALLVASKLGVTDFETWARHELEGYESADVPTPEYRRIRGTPKVWNPYHGYQDLRCGSPAMAQRISTMLLPYSVDQMESDINKGGSYILSYSPEVESSLMEEMQPAPLKPGLHMSESYMRGILGRVRTIVLEWSLKLEKLGVIGEGMTFSDAERAQAATVHIETLIQDVTGSQIQVHSPGAQQQQTVTSTQLGQLTALLDVLDTALRTQSDTSSEVGELRAEVETLRAQAQSPKPKRGVLRESLVSMRTILEGAAGGALASHLPQVVGLVSGLVRSLGG